MKVQGNMVVQVETASRYRYLFLLLYSGDRRRVWVSTHGGGKQFIYGK
jgi:hypothetical protein